LAAFLFICDVVCRLLRSMQYFAVKCMSCWFAVIVYLVLLPATVQAQFRTTETLSFQYLTINDGLSQGMINDMLQDRHGFMWFATKDGLNQYDGYRFRVYRHQPQDTLSLPDSHAEIIFEDVRGSIWVGTASGKVAVMDPRKGTFRTLQLEENENSYAADGVVRKIVEDNKGRIWVLYARKVFRLQPVQDENGQGVNWEMRSFSIPVAGRDVSITKTWWGALYFNGNSSKKIFEWDETIEAWKEEPVINAGLFKYLKNSPEGVFRLLQDPDRRMLYFVTSAGIISLDSTKKFTQIFPDALGSPFYCQIDQDGNLWFPHIERLYYLNPTTGKQVAFSVPGASELWRLQLTNCMFFDRSGLMWFGTRGYGLMTLNERSLRFRHTDNNSIYDFAENIDGEIYVDNGGSAFKMVNIATGALTDTVYRHKGKKLFSNFNEFSDPMMREENHIYYTGDIDFLYRYNSRTKEVKKWPLPYTQANTSYGHIMHIVRDGRDILWLATSEGLFGFNEKDGTWQVFRNDPLDTTSISFNNIFSLCPDPQRPSEILWVGTNGGGLNRLDLNTNKFKRYTDKDGLPNNVIYGILPDNRNRIWMSSNKGLSCLDPATGIFRNFEEKDGLQSNEFNHNAYLKASNGMLFFGGVNGFNYFYPDEIDVNPVIPPVVLTDFRIRNQSVSPEDKESPLTSKVYLSEKITLPYRDNMLTFEFAALDFTAPSRNQYRYRLDGFDPDWIEAGNVNTATYTNLDPGTYRFRVLGSNKDGVWNEEGATIELIILPPWYMTWWFRALAALAVLLAAYTFYRYRLQQALQLMAVRNRIASDLHDEIGSNLSNISIFSNVAKQQGAPPEQVEAILGKISDYTQTSMEAMNDIVWMINPRNDRFENIMVCMRMLASELFEATNYRLHMNLDESLNDMKLNMDARKNFYLIFKEAINNIAKYAKGSEVWIDMKQKGNMVILTLKDNGKGFDTSKPQQGNGLHNLKNRASQLKGDINIHSRQGEGTSLELKFPVH
jgi:signal transduction histidine kinase/ligand-binding sensor domain-containing protein